MHKCLCMSAGHCKWRDTVTDRQSLVACHEGVETASKNPYLPCIYLAELLDEEIEGEPSYRCLLYDKCTLEKNNVAMPACADCRDFLREDHEDFKDKFIDPLIVTDSKRTPTKALHGILAHKPAFLVCGGPSLKNEDYYRLLERGVYSLGVNNVAGLAPVNAFVCSDPPMKFHPAIFEDPRIKKFLPIPKLGCGRQRGRMREKLENGDFVWMNRFAKDCPDVWGFERRSWMMPDSTFFTDRAAAWGNQDMGVQLTGQPKTACTMLLGLRLLHYLGARTVFLLGCDFVMRQEEGYAFAQGRTQEAVNSNNMQFQVANEWLVQLRPVFEKFGFNVYNCCRESGLRAFDYVPFDKAIDFCQRDIPKKLDLEGWYEKETTETRQ